MEKIIDLKDLLKHEILDLYSAEEQIIEGLPGMIEKANDSGLKRVLTNHLEVSKIHKERLDKIKGTIMNSEDSEESKGFFSNLFGGINSVTSRGIEGLLKEAKKMMDEDMTPEAMDAAIIGAAQKIEHYEIAGYGTVRAYASELDLDFEGAELEKTLREEYEADDSLTKLAVGQLNSRAENAINTHENEEPNTDIYDRLTDSVSIMTSSDRSEEEEEEEE
jgi:ferritin-like metal-binding protein YciE